MQARPARCLDVGVEPPDLVEVSLLTSTLNLIGDALPQLIDSLLLPNTHVTIRC
jgi:hypothetical protein